MISLRSEAARKLLTYFFLHNEEELYVNEIARKLDVDKRNLVRKLRDLETEGLLKSRVLGNLKMYSINRSFPLYKEYEKIVQKTAGVEKELADILRSVKGVKEAYIFGSYASGKMDQYSDVDLLVVGDHKSLSLQKELRTLQSLLDREINVVDMGLKEYQRRKTACDPFLIDVLKKKHIKVI